MWVDVRQGHVRGFVVSPEWVGPKDIHFTLDELHDILGSDVIAICDAYIGTLRFILLAGRTAEMHTRPTVIDVDARVFGPAIVCAKLRWSTAAGSSRAISKYVHIQIH